MKLKYIVGFLLVLLFLVSCTSENVIEGDLSNANQEQSVEEVEIDTEMDDLDELDALMDELDQEISFDELEKLNYFFYFLIF